MALHWTCPKGHEWEFGDQVQPGQTLVCPVCGMGLGLPPPPQQPLPTIDIEQSADPHQPPAEPSSPTDPGSFAPDGAAGGVNRPSERPPRRRGQFTILQPHAKGGLGKVSLARDEDLQREVALKEIRSRYADDPNNQERFRAEAMITGRLEHPGIVPIYALGRDERGHPYYAMRFVHGRTLHDAIRDYHALPALLEFRQLLRHFNNVCQAVGYAHSQGVLHRDLKPSNVMLGEYGETLVLDWGLAKSLAKVEGGRIKDEPGEKHESSFLLPPSSLTQAGQVLGTPAYMSPEQAQGDHERIGPATDTYALGCILFEILTGRPPFDEPTTANVFDRKIREPPPVPSQLKPGVPPPLEAVCVKAMDRQPEQRYATPVALAQDVERWLADERVLAYQEPWLARASRWARRHKPLVAGTAVLLVVATVALAISNALIRREQKETENARQQAVDERNRALARFQIANETVDRMLQRMGHNRLALVTQMDLRADPAHRGLLLDAQRFYERFVLERGDDPGLQRDLALARRRLGDIHKMKGDHAAAELAYGAARDLLEALPSASRETALGAADLADCYHDLGLLYYLTERLQEAEEIYQKALAWHEQEQRTSLRTGESLSRERKLAVARTHHQLALLLRDTGRASTAREHFETAGAIRRGLAEERPGDHEIRRTIAQTHIDHALLLAELRDTQEAERLARRARELLSRLVAELESNKRDDPDVVEYRHELASSFNNLGLVLQNHKPDEAEAAYRESLGIREALAREFPTRPDFRYEHALCRLNLGMLHYRPQGDNDKAEAEWLKARTDLERLVNEFADVPIYASRLGQALNNLAVVRGKKNDRDGARELLEAGIGHQRAACRLSPRHAEYRARLVDHLLDLADVEIERSQVAKAAAAADEAALLVPGSAAASRQAAGLLARCAAAAQKGTSGAPPDPTAAEEYARKAVAHLRAAIAAGFSDAADLEKATDLESLRGRPDFLKLRQELLEAAQRKPPS